MVFLFFTFLEEWFSNYECMSVVKGLPHLQLQKNKIKKIITKAFKL